MKRISILFLILLLFGCSSSKTDDVQFSEKTKDLSSTEKHSVEDTTNSNTLKLDKPLIVYEDENVIITFLGLGEKGVEFDIENLTDKNLTIQCDAVSINGFSSENIIMSDDVAPQSIGTVCARTKDFNDIFSSLGRVSGQFSVIDFNDYFSYDIKFNKVIDKNVTDLYDYEWPLTLLYSDDSVDFYYYSLDENGVNFLVRNKTSELKTIQADSISVNKRSLNDIIMSDDVAPLSAGIVTAKCDVDVSNEVATIGGSFSVINFDNYNSYNISFINIEIK